MAAVATRTQGLPSNPSSRTNSPVDHTKRSTTNEEPKRTAIEHRAAMAAADSKVSPKKTIKSPPNRAVTSQPKPAAHDPSATNNSTTTTAAAAAAAPAAAPSTSTMAASTSTKNFGQTNNNTTTTTTSVPTITATTASSTTQEPSSTDTKISLPPPLAPPVVTEASAPSDYFSVAHNKYGEEPNPFEQSFSVNDGLVPNKALLPPASSITSPSPNLGSGFNWGLNSLRSGPLSPAMLTGPSGFDPSLRTGLTPNESGIRSGLTPGGSGSMFPVPSPSAALFGFGSGTTPGTMEFHKTALAAQAQNNRNKFENLQQPVPKVEEDEKNGNMLHAPLQSVKLNPSATKPGHMRQASDPFGGDADAAASGLYMLAQQGQQQQGDTFMTGSTSFTPANLLPGQPVNNVDTSPNKRSSVVSRGQTSTTSNGRSISEASDGTDEGVNDHQTNGRNGKPKATPKKAAKGAAARRKADDAKAPPAKKAKKSIDETMEDEDEDMMDEDDDDDKLDSSGKKMTEDEKRKNFLERNRVAALKCRQRKKQWLANLQAKVEYYGAENDALHSQVANLRDEVIQLKTLLLAHKDCPVNRSAAVQNLAGVDGIGALGQASEYQMNHAYGVAGANMAPPGRRFS